ncbi:MAG: hypothetical protein JJU20_13885 [Opitutales bacterium]|nr:hypothetical protein [Opitutales bacterium]
MKVPKYLKLAVIPAVMLSGLWLGYLKYAEYRDVAAERTVSTSKPIEAPERLSADRVEDGLLADALRDPTQFDAEALATMGVAENSAEEPEAVADSTEVAEEDRLIPLKPNWAVIEGTRRTVASYASIRTEAMRDPDSDYNAAQRDRMMENMRQRLQARRGDDSAESAAD